MLKQLRIATRVIQINWIFARFGLDEFILHLSIFAPLRFVAWLNPWNWYRPKTMTRGVRLRMALERLGPIFVKFGQVLSTRRDLLPDDISDELAKLQDQVPPFSSQYAIKMLEQIYGRPTHDVFDVFDPIPLASASIAQVHAATLPGGHDVVVKLLRPNIKKKIDHDVAILEVLAALAERYLSFGPRLRAVEVVTEFSRSLYDELDLHREGANASQLRRNFLGSHMIYVPEIYWSYTHRDVLVMERIHGVPIADIKTLRKKKVNLQRLAEHGVEIFFTQVFRDCFFHADMHPGNVFVNIKDPQNPVYMAVDFGIMGTLNPVDQRYLAENFLAFFKRDYRRVAELHIASGWVNPDTRIDVFESAIRTVCEPMFERPLSEISCAQVLIRLFETAARFDMEVQPQLLLLQKTLLNVEGLGRQLYPELDLWKTARPFLERWMRKEISGLALMKKAILQAPRWLEHLPEIPGLVHAKLLHQQDRYFHHLPRYSQKKHEEKKLRRARRKGFFQGIGLMVLIILVGFIFSLKLGLKT